MLMCLVDVQFEMGSPLTFRLPQKLPAGLLGTFDSSWIDRPVFADFATTVHEVKLSYNIAADGKDALSGSSGSLVARFCVKPEFGACAGG